MNNSCYNMLRPMGGKDVDLPCVSRRILFWSGAFLMGCKFNVRVPSSKSLSNVFATSTSRKEMLSQFVVPLFHFCRHGWRRSGRTRRWQRQQHVQRQLCWRQDSSSSVPFECWQAQDDNHRGRYGRRRQPCWWESTQQTPSALHEKLK